MKVQCSGFSRGERIEDRFQNDFQGDRTALFKVLFKSFKGTEEHYSKYSKTRVLSLINSDVTDKSVQGTCLFHQSSRLQGSLKLVQAHYVITKQYVCLNMPAILNQKGTAELVHKKCKIVCNMSLEG